MALGGFQRACGADTVGVARAGGVGSEAGRGGMPTVQAGHLFNLARDLLVGAGVPASEAEIVARHSIGANLAGHDSHGIIAIPTYIDRVDKGHIVPGAPFEVVQETPTTTVIDGHWGFGYVVNERAMLVAPTLGRQHDEYVANMVDREVGLTQRAKGQEHGSHEDRHRERPDQTRQP